MKQKDVKRMLAATKLPATYYSWPEKKAPALPYLVWYFPGSDNFAADNKVYQRILTLNIELYTENKSFATEDAVEAVLNDFGMVWDKVETFIESERMYQVLYTMEVFINE